MDFLSKFVLVSFFTTVGASSTLASFGPRDCDQHRSLRQGFAWDERRGEPSEFDPGPASEDSESWLKLYGQVPNYRTIGKKILGGWDEKFRWQMGPMWYRGRLGKNQVKVFVVGQEGAQDENVTNRAFTGSTGTRVQKFLNHLGIYENYLFMNTFIYTIQGQRLKQEEEGYENYVALEQGKHSPIVEYRHMLFDNVIKQNPESISLFMGVGGGGKESLATWINSRSGNDNCRSWLLQYCDTTKLVEHFAKQGVLKGDEKILAVGVHHPGGAAFGEGSDHIQKSFDEAAASVADYIDIFPGWLNEDPQELQFANCYGGKRKDRLRESFRYGHAPVPFRDFSFATNWRMGDKGTSSNRDGADKIQVFSEWGRYAIVRNESVPLGEWKTSSGRTVFNDQEPMYEYYKPPFQGYHQLRDQDRGLLWGMKDNEVPNEHPRYKSFGEDESQGDLEHVKQFDPGPASQAVAKALMSWPDFQEIDESAYKNDGSFGFGPSYRGNSKDPKIVILADQMGHTDFFSTRALSGEGGQMLQAFLRKTGLEERGDYLILRSLPVDTLGVPVLKKAALALGSDSQGRSALKTIASVIRALSSSSVKLVTMGPVAEQMGDLLKQQLPQIHSLQTMMVPDREFSHVNQWREVAKDLGLNVPSSGSLYALYMIPRKDLPYSSRWWMGTTGENADRAYGVSLYEKEVNDVEFDYTGHYYRLKAPSWIWKISDDDPRPLTNRESELVEMTLQSLQ